MPSSPRGCCAPHGRPSGRRAPAAAHGCSGSVRRSPTRDRSSRSAAADTASPSTRSDRRARPEASAGRRASAPSIPSVATPASSSSVGAMSTSPTAPVIRRPPLRAAGQADDRRHLQRFAVEEQAVLGFAVIAEPFAMIGDDRDDRAVEDAARWRPSEKAPDELVGVRDLAVVGRSHRVRGRRRVRRVRLVEVQEHEQRARSRARRATPPAPRPFRAVALRVGQRLPAPRDRQRIVEESNPRRCRSGAAARTPRPRRRSRSRRPSAATRACAPLVGDGVADVVANAVMRRQPAGEQRRVRRQRERHVRCRRCSKTMASRARRSRVGVAPRW